MSLVVTPLHPLFAARITGVDLSRPVDQDASSSQSRVSASVGADLAHVGGCLAPSSCL